jgi:hypothetical protein
MPGIGTGPHADPSALQQVSEKYLFAGRRVLRGGLTERDAPLVTGARQLLRAAAGKGPPPPWEKSPAAAGTPGQGPAALDWPPTADGIAAPPARAARSRRPAARPRRPPRPGRPA